jgi:segregation and condensation protein B
MNTADAKRILETALICSSQPLPVRDMRVLFDDELGVDTIKVLLLELQEDWAQRGLELVSVGSGWRFQSRPEMRDHLDRLHPESRRATRAPPSRRWPSSRTANRPRAATWKTFAA